MRGTILAISILAGCAGSSGDDTGTPATECGGAGAASIQVGDGGLAGFTPWQSGDTVQIVDMGGQYGFQAELLSAGLDTTAPISTFLRFSTGDETETQDVGANMSFQCPNEGPGWTGVFAPLDDPWQDAAAVAELDGVALNLTVLATDQSDETAQITLDLVYAAP